MRVLITLLVAAAVIGGGVAYGSATHSSSSPPPASQATPPPGVRPAPTGQPDAKAKCEQAAEQFRKQHPDGYSGGCNSGEGTLTTP